jgi:4-amino-4-deoxy-L-arabinose transferase-like glycosyltransferase
MQVRKQHILPEAHYNPTSPAGVTGPPSDSERRAYITKLLPSLPVNEAYFTLPYESFQPPLYYLVTGLLAHLVPANPQTILYLGRMVAILLGAATVYFCWLTTRELAPRAPTWAIAAAGMVALLPSFSFDSAHASNDSMVNLTATAAFYVWTRGLRHPEFDRQLWGAGVMLGLTLLSKLTALALIPRLALVIVFRVFQARPRTLGWSNWLKRALYMTVGATASALLVSGWWFVRNAFIYGEPTGNGRRATFLGREVH